MKHSFNITIVAQELIPDKVSRNAFLWAVLIGIVELVIIILVLNLLPRRLPLLLTNPWGEARLIEKQWLITLPFINWMIVAINLILSKFWVSEGVLVPRILSIGALIAGVMTGVALWGVIQSFFL